MGKNKRIDEAEKCITDQEIEIKELGQDIKRNRTVQALYKKIKDLQTQTELLLKNFSIEREQHQAEIMEKDMKIDKLVASWEKYNETRNKIKKKEEGKKDDNVVDADFEEVKEDNKEKSA